MSLVDIERLDRESLPRESELFMIPDSIEEILYGFVGMVDLPISVFSVLLLIDMVSKGFVEMVEYNRKENYSL